MLRIVNTSDGFPVGIIVVQGFTSDFDDGSMDRTRKDHRWGDWYVNITSRFSTTCSHSLAEDALLQRKANKELLEPIDVRMNKVREFLKLFRPGLIYDIVPIHDVYGPTAVEPNIQALVVSKETLKGASSSPWFPYLLSSCPHESDNHTHNQSLHIEKRRTSHHFDASL